MFFRILLSVMVLGDLLWWWWADRRLRALPARPVWRGLLAAFVGSLVVCLLIFLAFPAAVRRAHGVLPVPLHAMVYVWHMLVLPFTGLVLLLTGAGRLGVAAVRYVAGKRPPVDATRDESPAANDGPLGRPLSRRQLLAAAAAAVPPLVASGIVGYGVSNLGRFRVNQFDLPIPNLPPDLDGLRIAHVSDVHVGKFTVSGMLRRVADATNLDRDGRRPHLVLFTGDLIDLSATDLPAAIDFVRTIDPLHGLAMIEGNHDLIDKPARFYTDVPAAKIPLLIDREMTFELPGRPTPVQLLGMRWSPQGNDGTGGGGADQIGPAMGRLLPQRRPGAFPILMAHHPHAFDPAVAAGIPLTLAGHTHGGQVMPFGVGFGPIFYRYYSGLYRKGDSRCFVSNGVGNWFPLRVGAPAEVVHMTLRRA